MKVRGYAIFVAVLLAAAATGAVYLYVQGVRHQTVRTPSGTVTVIVPKEDIAVGTALDKLIDQGGFTTLSIPSDAVIKGAVTDLQQLRGKSTVYPILQGEQVTLARLSNSTIQATGGPFGIDAGNEAVTISLDPERVLAGGIQAGNHVVVFATVNPPGNGGATTITIVPDARVLVVVSPSGTGGVLNGSSGGNSIVMLSLSPKDAAKVILAQEQGHVWLSLLPPNQNGTAVPPVSIDQLSK